MGSQELNTSNDVFAENLRHALSAKGWTQGDLTAACGITQGTISNYVRGKREPTASQLRLLAVALGVTMEQLLTGHGQQQRASPAESGTIKAAKAEAERLARLLGEAEHSLSKLRSFLG